MAHVYLRRALLSTELFGGDGSQLALLAHTTMGSPTWTFVIRPTRPRSAHRIRTWLAEQGDADQAFAQRRRLLDGTRRLAPAAVRGRLLRADVAGEVRRPRAAARVRGDRRRGAGPRRRTAQAEPRLPHPGHQPSRQRGDQGPLPARARSTDATGGARASASPTPAPTSRRCAPRATLDGDEYVIDGHKIWTSYSDVAEWCIVLARTDPDVPKHKGLSAFAVPMHQPGIEQRPLRMINGITTEFGQVALRRRPRAGREHDRRTGRGLAAGDDDRQPRTRAGRARASRSRYLKAVQDLGGDRPAGSRRGVGRARRPAGLGVRRGRDAADPHGAPPVGAARRRHPRVRTARSTSC